MAFLTNEVARCVAWSLSRWLHDWRAASTFCVILSLLTPRWRPCWCYLSAHPLYTPLIPSLLYPTLHSPHPALRSRPTLHHPYQKAQRCFSSCITHPLTYHQSPLSSCHLPHPDSPYPVSCLSPTLFHPTTLPPELTPPRALWVFCILNDGSWILYEFSGGPRGLLYITEYGEKTSSWRSGPPWWALVITLLSLMPHSARMA